MVESENRHGKTKQIPNLIKDYNMNMSGVDRSDQMLSYHSALRKTIRWYKKVGVHMIEMFVNNSHYLYAKATGEKMKVHQFKEIVVKYLIGHIARPKHLIPTGNFHYLGSIPSNGKKQRPTKRCKYCSSNKTRKETRYVCMFCVDTNGEHPPLCIEPCFCITMRALELQF